MTDKEKIEYLEQRIGEAYQVVGALTVDLPEDPKLVAVLDILSDPMNHLDAEMPVL